jgi:hypothetical protein
MRRGVDVAKLNQFMEEIGIRFGKLVPERLWEFFGMVRKELIRYPGVDSADFELRLRHFIDEVDA